jgi:HMG (high mobility group) box
MSQSPSSFRNWSSELSSSLSGSLDSAMPETPSSSLLQQEPDDRAAPSQQEVAPETIDAEDDESDRPPRPPNSWILYRSSKSREIRAQLQSASGTATVSSRDRQAEISRLVSNMWKNESQEVKDHYSALAEEKRVDHRQRYPVSLYQSAYSCKSPRAK